MKIPLLFLILLTQFCIGQESRKLKISKSMALYNATLGHTQNDFFRIDTVADKKVALFKASEKKKRSIDFDSISFNQFFIIGYRKQKITVYNYTLKELYLPYLRAAKLNPHFPILHIIQENELKTLNLLGNEYKRGDGPFDMVIESLPRGYTLFNIIKKDDGFYFYSDYIQDLLSKAQMKSWDNYSKVFHAEDVAEMQYMGKNAFRIERNGTHDFLIYTHLKNGKYNLNTMDYLYTENPTPEMEKENAKLPKNLDKLSIKYGFCLIEKDGLMTYYPLVKEPKYKTLGDFDFHNNFVRFELPNGDKGWLGIDGKEYFDE